MLIPWLTLSSTLAYYTLWQSGTDMGCRESAHFALGVEDNSLRAWYPEDLMSTTIQRNTDSGWEVEIQLRYLSIQLGSCSHGERGGERERGEIERGRKER